MRVAVVDIGTNSTRLLVADVYPGSGEIRELARRSEVTRLGVGVDRTGRLSDEAIARVQRVLDEYAAAIDELGAERRLAVLTSATRDAVNGPELTARVRDHYRLEAQTIPGEEEARLSFLGAMSGRPPGNGETVAVLDIGGGSTELIVGRDGAVLHHVSTQAGVVRHSERHLHDDPPTAGQRAGLAAEVLGIFEAAVPAELRERTEAMIAVAGTATSMAAIDQALEPYDSSRVHGYRLSRASAEAIGERLASMTDAERRLVAGLHPDRAPTIVAGSILLVEAMRAFGLDEVEVSEHDILYGVALDAARIEQPRAR